jgi:tryptophanyl-tRNA synthetase
MQSLHITHPSMGLLSYPILQSADILIVKADLVPVGKDQKSHIELTREIAHEFNRSYKPIFPLPEPLIGSIETLVGTDGKNKMSKSLGNCIYLSDSRDTVNEKVHGMFTDPEKVHVNDPGHPETCPVFMYHKAFSDNHERIEEVKIDCKKGTLGCGVHKEELATILNSFLDPLRTKRSEFEKQKDSLDDILTAGEHEVTKTAYKTLDETLSVMKIKL